MWCAPGLAARARRPAAFRSRCYLALDARGPSAGKVVAFARGEGTERLVAAVPRLLGRHVAEGGRPTDPALWADTALPLPEGWPSRWTCAISGRSVRSEAGWRGCGASSSSAWSRSPSFWPITDS